MRVEDAKIEKYVTTRKEHHRPPSRGGDTGAWHQHVLVIDGKSYSFLNAGSRQWVYKSDSVSFEWEWDKTSKYRNIKTETIAVKDKAGKPIVRQVPATKKWRTAPPRMPVSRRENRD